MLPDWVSTFKVRDGGETSFNPCKCDRCGYEWYPLINQDGTIKVNICPKCKSKLWNTPKK